MSGVRFCYRRIELTKRKGETMAELQARAVALAEKEAHAPVNGVKRPKWKLSKGILNIRVDGTQIAN